MFQLYFYCPIKDKEKVKSALFEVGAGRIGNYDCCCFEYEGVGQFRPLVNSSPAIGSLNKIEKVTEVKIEMVFSDEKKDQVIKALKSSHPYEEVAYGIIRLEY